MTIDSMTVAVAALLTGVYRAVTGTPSFLTQWGEGRRRQKEATEQGEELQRLLTSYLYPLHPDRSIDARVPLVPAMKDRWGPPERQFSGSGNAVAMAYATTFCSGHDHQVVQPVIDVQPDDAPVLIASHLVSEEAAKYFGDPESRRPIHEIHYHGDGGGFKANLRWTVYTPEPEKKLTKRELFQGVPRPRTEPVHNLSDLGDSNLPQPTFTRQGDLYYQLDDYLLITVLPRDSRFDRRMISLAGLHKPGTLAAEKLLSDTDLALKILNGIREKVLNVPYYQALIALKVDHTTDGLPCPAQLKLIDAEPIDVIRVE